VGKVGNPGGGLESIFAMDTMDGFDEGGDDAGEQDGEELSVLSGDLDTKPPDPTPNTLNCERSVGAGGAGIVSILE